MKLTCLIFRNDCQINTQFASTAPFTYFLKVCEKHYEERQLYL